VNFEINNEKSRAEAEMLRMKRGADDWNNAKRNHSMMILSS
jgi:hypothetical protein